MNWKFYFEKYLREIWQYLDDLKKKKGKPWAKIVLFSWSATVVSRYH